MARVIHLRRKAITDRRWNERASNDKQGGWNLMRYHSSSGLAGGGQYNLPSSQNGRSELLHLFGQAALDPATFATNETFERFPLKRRVEFI
jgi:hypothetical protein